MRSLSREKVLLKVSPMKEVMQFSKKGNLIIRYIVLSEILKGGAGSIQTSLTSKYVWDSPDISYVLAKELSQDGDYIIRWYLKFLDKELSYKEAQIAISTKGVWKLRTQVIPCMTIQLRSRIFN